jgi:hypothetical protein
MTNTQLFHKDTVDFVRGPATQFINDELPVTFARIVERLSTLDAAAYKIISSIYREPWRASVAAFYNKEIEASAHLADNGMALPDAQKFMAFEAIIG